MDVPDTITAAQEVKRAASDHTLPYDERLSRVSRAMTKLSEALSQEQRALKKTISDLGGVSESTTPEENDDDDRGDDETCANLESRSLLESTAKRASSIIERKLDEIVRDLDAGIGGFPENAVRNARKYRDLMTPRLIQVLEETTATAKSGGTVEGNAHLFAVCLLTEFEAEDAFPAIREIFSLPGELPFDLFGDFVTECFAGILGRFTADRPDVLDEIIGDTALNEYVRWEAAQTYIYLVRDGRMEQAEAVRRLGRNICRLIEQGETEIADFLVSELENLATEETTVAVIEAFSSNPKEAVSGISKIIETAVATTEIWPDEGLRRCPATGIEDTIEELRSWPCFQEEEPPQRAKRRRSPPPPHFFEDRSSAVPVNTIVNAPRVGRNQPCPCGSGKKYKKCCGAKK